MKLLIVGENPSLIPELAGFADYLKEKAGGLEVLAFTVSPSRSDAASHANLGINKMYIAVSEKAFPDQVAEAALKIMEDEKPDIVAGLSTKTGNDVLSRVSGALNIPMFTEIIDVDVRNGEILFHRAILGGRAISVEKPSLPVAVTIPARKYQPPQPSSPGEIVAVELPPTRYKLVGVEEKEKGGINIEEAEIVVGVGRGFRKKEDLQLAHELAELLGGAVGCSRPIAADYHWLPEDSWIGISGKKIRAKLYFPIGISGAPQHMSAVMDTKIIVAVNKDKNAPVFQYADYGIVADLYKFLPVFIQKLKEKLGK